MQPYSFIARYDDPKGLFQVLEKDKNRYFIDLISQPIRVYREINKQKLIEVPTFDCMVISCQDECMNVVDRNRNIHFILNVDRFIEIDFIKKSLEAKESGQVWLIQMVNEPGL